MKLIIFQFFRKKVQATPVSLCNISEFNNLWNRRVLARSPKHREEAQQALDDYVRAFREGLSLNSASL